MKNAQYKLCWDIVHPGFLDADGCQSISTILFSSWLTAWYGREAFQAQGSMDTKAQNQGINIVFLESHHSDTEKDTYLSLSFSHL